ncbi:MAG: ADP-glyceromanno-heptose 6-epimerase [Candidatus Firestonebacteria bacterium RIFOXYA2_FULL_40_8]|nr:MAG: ADP-glyceromanno-heptose 6-epimerase [Candidatus Firestonebacteria bacterium RIFOXYA2_FULL_40_8]
MKVIVTGAAGFIGSCIVRKLNDEGINNILAVDQSDNPMKWKNLEGKRIDDYADKDELVSILPKYKPDAIIHMGACSSTMQMDAAFLRKNNFEYSKTLAEYSLKNKVSFLYASSAATYGDGTRGYSDEDKSTLIQKPLNPYGNSKQLFDLWLLKNKLQNKVTGFKFFNVFGPNEYHKEEMMSLMCKAFAGVAAGKPMRLFKSYKKGYADGEQMRDFIYVKDAVDIVYYFLTHPGKRGIFNVGTGKARSWNDVAKALFTAAGKKPKIEYIEMPVIIRDKYQYFTEADMTKLRRAGCKHEFLSLESAIKDYAKYLKNKSYW